MNEEKRRVAAEEKLTHYLAQHQMRRTPERFAILDKVLTFRGHFLVESIYLSLTEDGYHVSRATVYNTVKLLEDCGIVRRLHISNGSADEFECRDDRTNHLHLVCSRCGKVKEVKDAELSRMLALRKYPAFVMTGFDLYVSGICARCRGGGRKKK